ncbi:MAG TPA: ATP-binding protein [Massilibacterium sp.]|nr:ATP-binding protein [Massilibacterium sp.]
MARSIAITKINDDLSDFRYLFQIYDRVFRDREPKILNFTHCNFLRSNAVAFLGAINKQAKQLGIDLTFDWDSMQSGVHMNLAQSGFVNQIKGNVPGWKGNSVPYREDSIAMFDGKEIVRHLLANWLGNGRIKLGKQLKYDIVQVVYEIFINSVEHSSSDLGIVSCGQYHPNIEELCFTVLDLGCGIPDNVRRFTNMPLLPAGNAIKWAFYEGTSTSTTNNSARGNGLKRLSDFVQLNKGEMLVFSYKGVGNTNKDGNYFSNIGSNFFPGTIVNIKLNCDKKVKYVYAD